VRRSRATVRQVATLEAGMWLVGTVDHFCPPHRRLGNRTPAQAAGLTDHRWTVHELLTSSHAPAKRQTAGATAALVPGDSRYCLTTV